MIRAAILDEAKAIVTQDRNKTYGEPEDLFAVWRDDLVAFAIGCSFSFEEALLADGIDVRHVTRGTNVPMYRTNVPTERTTRLHGPLVVSMRPMKAADAIRKGLMTTDQKYAEEKERLRKLIDAEKLSVSEANQHLANYKKRMEEAGSTTASMGGQMADWAKKAVVFLVEGA